MRVTWAGRQRRGHTGTGRERTGQDSLLVYGAALETLSAKWCAAETECTLPPEAGDGLVSI